MVETDAALRDIGIERRELQPRNSRLESSAETRAARGSVRSVIATGTGEPLSASNFLSRDFRPALQRQGCRG